MLNSVYLQRYSIHLISVNSVRTHPVPRHKCAFERTTESAYVAQTQEAPLRWTRGVL